MELISGLNNTLSVVAVHNKNEALGVLEVVPPQGSDLLKWNKESIRPQVHAKLKVYITSQFHVWLPITQVMSYIQKTGNT